jgi:hypothetical protein
MKLWSKALALILPIAGSCLTTAVMEAATPPCKDPFTQVIRQISTPDFLQVKAYPRSEMAVMENFSPLGDNPQGEVCCYDCKAVWQYDRAWCNSHFPPGPLRTQCLQESLDEYYICANGCEDQWMIDCFAP